MIAVRSALKRCALLLLSFGVLSLPAHAADWGKVSWGMSRAEVSAQYPAATPEGDRLKAVHAGEILGVPFDATFEFREDKLVSLALRSDNASPAISRSSADSFRDLLIGKYGAPLHLKAGPTSLEGVWRSDRTVIKFFAPSTPAPGYPVYSFYYWSRADPRYDEI